MDHQLLSIELEDPLSKERYWSLPGGAVEAGETAQACAIRETKEETGYDVTLVSGVFTNHYQFPWNGKVFDCTTHWFLAALDDARTTKDTPGLVDDADYLLRAEWLDWPESRPLFLYNSGLEQALDQFLPITAHRPVG